MLNNDIKKVDCYYDKQRIVKLFHVHRRFTGDYPIWNNNNNSNPRDLKLVDSERTTEPC